MLPGEVGLKSIALLCTRFGCGRTRSIISWSLEVWNLDWSVESMALGLGVEDRCPSTSWTPLLLAVGFTSSGCWSFSSRLSSSESIVFSKNWRHSCSSRLRKRRPSSSCRDQESEVTKWLCDVFLCAVFFQPSIIRMRMRRSCVKAARLAFTSIITGLRVETSDFPIQ